MIDPSFQWFEVRFGFDSEMAALQFAADACKLYNGNPDFQVFVDTHYGQDGNTGHKRVIFSPMAYAICAELARPYINSSTACERPTQTTEFMVRQC